MKDLTEKLWPAFVAEVTEHLDALELALVGNRQSADIHEVFRSFHTIKGGCAMMGFSGMEALAHASEDLLDPLRKSEGRISEAMVSLLLEVVDALKAQLAEVARTRQPPASDDTLLQRLRTGVARTENDHRHEHHREPVAAGTRGDGNNAATHQHLSSGSALATFTAQAAAQLPTLFNTLLGDATADAATRNALAQLAQQAEAAGIGALAALLARLPAATARRALLADAAARLAVLEKEQGVDAGTAAIARACAPELTPVFIAALHTLQASIDGLCAGDETQVAARRAASACLPAQQTAQLLGLADTAALLRLVAQILRDIARTNIAAEPALCELLAVAGLLGLDLQAADGTLHAEDDDYRAVCAPLRERLLAAAGTLPRSDARVQQREALAQRTGMHPELLASLGQDALAAVEDALAQGLTLAEIEADLEAMPDHGEEFVGWLNANGTLIGNHTVFHHDVAGGVVRESTGLRFLAALKLTADEISEGLAELDPLRRYFTLRIAGLPGLRTNENRAANRTQGNLNGSEASCAPGENEVTPHTARAATTSAAPAVGVAGNTLRIDSAALDRFVDRVGEMVMLRNGLSHTLARDDLATRLQRARALLGHAGQTPGAADLAFLRELLADLDQRQEQLAQADVRMLGALDRMQEDVLALRVVPIAMVFNRLPRLVRDLAQAQGKVVELVLRGEDVRIDKGMVDLLLEPLMHLVRNAIDHGIESAADRECAGKPASATLAISARQQGNTLLIDIADDGRGLDYARIRARGMAQGLLAENENASERELAALIFQPGFSTAEQVTEISGRGVGMDVVKTRIAQTGGQIDVHSVSGSGATFTLRLPLSVAIQSVVHVSAGARQLAVPDRNVLEIINVPARSLQSLQGQAACLLRGVTLPVYNLAALLGDGDENIGNGPAGAATGGGIAQNALEIVVLSDGLHRIGLQVDQVIGRPEVFVRDIHPDLARIPGVGGASVLGDGRVVIILDCENLFELALRRAQSLRSLLRTA